MGVDTDIEWCHHTFNPWWGCVRVSPGCEHCYAEAFAKRTGNAVWGVQAPRRFFGDKHWAEPLKWAEKAAKAGVKHRVFCASMADVFEDRETLHPHRERLWRTIEATHAHLDWLLLTKRPENIRRFGVVSLLEKCWVGTTTEDQRRAEERLPYLLDAPAAVRFVSAEPLLGPVRFDGFLRGKESHAPFVDWVIVGGESGGGARSCDAAWIRGIVQQCKAADVACFVKQLGAKPLNFKADHDWFDGQDFHTGGLTRLKLVDRKGGDIAEFPADLRIREFPLPPSAEVER